MKLVGGDSGHVEREELVDDVVVAPSKRVVVNVLFDRAGEQARRRRRPRARAGGIEWEDDMVAVNRMTTPSNMRWKLIDRQTGAENAAIDGRFRVGDRVKIRLLNEMGGDHPMHHPLHVHGAGRFVVLNRDGVTESNVAW